MTPPAANYHILYNDPAKNMYGYYTAVYSQYDISIRNIPTITPVDLTALYITVAPHILGVLLGTNSRINFCARLCKFACYTGIPTTLRDNEGYAAVNKVHHNIATIIDWEWVYFNVIYGSCVPVA